MVELSEAPDRRMRMTQLAHRTCLSKSRLSHQIKRMESAGLIDRAECPEDRRGSFAVLTRRGLSVLIAAAPEHVEDVRQLFIDLLPPQDLPGFTRSMAAVAAELENRALKEKEEHDQAVKTARRGSRGEAREAGSADGAEHREVVAGGRGGQESRESHESRDGGSGSGGNGGNGGGSGRDARGSRHGRPSREPLRR